MQIRTLLTRCLMIGLSLFTVIAAAQLLTGCGSDDYEKPSTTQTPTALIQSPTLYAWMADGKVNGTGYDRVVILDITSYATFTNGHIPGALFLDQGDIAQDRKDGVGVTGYEVLDGSKMDELIQKYGIDGKTTVVFTGSSLVNAARMYFTFRYWGFPKNRLKLLDGLNAPWAADYGLAAGDPPVAARANYTVRDNPGLRDDLRASLAEMIAYADGNVPNAVAVDVRGSTGQSYSGTAGKTPGSFSPGPDYVVFEGRIKGAKAIVGSSLYASNVFKPVDELITAFTSTAVGLDSTKTAYVYCVKGAASSVTFFVLDGILGWPAAVYDGSWSQWGQLSANAANKGQLTAGSYWKTDEGRSEAVTYNYAASKAVEQFTADGGTCSAIYSGATVTNSYGASAACSNKPNSVDADANRIEDADKLYMQSGGSDATPGGGTSVPAGC